MAIEYDDKVYSRETSGTDASGSETDECSWKSDVAGSGYYEDVDGFFNDGTQ